MAKSILSQDEVDALLNASNNDDLPSDEDEHSQQQEVKPYTFSRTDLISSEQLRSLNNLHETLTSELQPRLSLFLRAHMDLRLAATDQQSYSDFIDAASETTHMILFSAKPFPGMGIIELNLPVIYSIIDRILGGDGNAEASNRILTEIERAIFEPVRTMLFEELEQTLSSLSPVDLQLERIETNPEYAQITSPGAPVLVACIDVQIGNTSGLLNICYPMPMINAILRELEIKAKHQVSADVDPRSAEHRKTLLGSLLDIPVSMPVILGEANLSARDWVEVRTGDILVLPQRINDPVHLQAENEPLYQARVGRLGKQLAVRLLHRIAKNEDQNINSLLD